MSRLLSLRSVLTILVVFGVLVSELRFDWVERMLGVFLVKTNTMRPELGSIWEVNRQTQTARQTLEQIVTTRQTSQREARNAGSLDEIFKNLAPDQGVMVPPDDFRRLYVDLPSVVAREIITPFEILNIFNEKRFARTYVERQGSTLQVYFLDPENRVLRQLIISAEQLALITQAKRVVEGTLDTLPEFKNRIYSVDQFLKALEELSPDSRQNVLPQPERLLQAGGRIVRIGISDETISGNIEIGFEIQTGAAIRVIFMPAREWAVWDLRSMLEGGKTPGHHSIERGPQGRN